MPKVSAKRQITLPVSQCDELGIKPGDQVESFVANGQITLIKKRKGAANGLLKSIEVDKSMTDQESLQSTL